MFEAPFRGIFAAVWRWPKSLKKERCLSPFSEQRSLSDPEALPMRSSSTWSGNFTLFRASLGEEPVQPIAIRDVIRYLVGCWRLPEHRVRILISEEKYFNLSKNDDDPERGPPPEKSFIPVPFSNITAYAYFASLLTPVRRN